MLALHGLVFYISIGISDVLFTLRALSILDIARLYFSINSTL